MQRTRARQVLRLAAALVVALLLHLPLLLIEPLPRPDAVERPLRPIRLVKLPPSEQGPPPAVTRKRAPPARGVQQLTEPTELAEPTEPRVESMEPRAGPVGPRKVDLFPAGAIVRAAEPGPAPSKGEPVGKRLGDWSQQFADAERARIGDDTPALRELGRRMGDWLLISGQAGESLRRAAPLGLGPASTLLAAFNAWQQEVETRRAVGRPHEAVPFYANPLMDHGPIESFVALCWGNCTGYFGHRVSYLVVTIEVDHDEAGVPSDWRVWESSGDARFDEAALDAIKDAIAWAPPDVLKSDRPAAYSRWQLSASAHRYHRGETLMDPAFVPPGDEIEKYSDLLGKTTVVKRARLVAVRYRSAPEPAGGPRG